MRRILVFSTTTGYQLRSFSEAALDLGVELTFATDRCHRLDDPWRDAAVPVRFHEEDASLQAIVDAARARPVAGVIAVGDRPVVLAARAAQALGLRGNPPDAAAASVTRSCARASFAAAGLPVPWFFEADAASDLAADPRVRYPCVVKPIGLSGSRGVIRANTPEELDEAIARLRALLSRKDVRAIRSGLGEAILVEGFIDGREFAIEGVLTDGVFRAFAIFDKPDPLDGPFFEETIYVTPSDLPVPTQQLVIDQVGRAARSLGLANGPVHAECRVGAHGVFTCSKSPRGRSGATARRCCNSVRTENLARPPSKTSCCDMQSARTCRGTQGKLEAAGVMMIPIPTRGMLKRVHGIDTALPYRVSKRCGSRRRRTSCWSRFRKVQLSGVHLCARAPTAGSVVGALRDAQARLRFEVAAPIALVTG